MPTKSKSNKNARPTKKKADPKKRVIIPSVLEASEQTNALEPIANEYDVEEHEIDPSDAEIIIDESALEAVKNSTSKALTPTDPVALYLSEIRKYPVLTREEEQVLARRYRESGDPKAAEALVTSNLRFVVKVAAEYSKFGARLIDLIQEGNVGLMHAVREFNPYKGVRLITYAVWWIRGYIQDYLMRQYSMVRIGTTQTQRKLFYRLQKERELLEKAGDPHNLALLSSRLGASEEEILSMQQRLGARDISLNQPLDSESKTTLLDMEQDGSTTADEELAKQEQINKLRENIDTIREQLTEKELYILENRLLADEPLTLQEIGDHYGVTREAIRQIENRLMARIRSSMQE